MSNCCTAYGTTCGLSYRSIVYRLQTGRLLSFIPFFSSFFIVNDNIVLYINTFHTETGPLCQALRSFTNL